MKSTTDHEEIRLWVEAHNGRPEEVHISEADGWQLRINFPGKQDDVFLVINPQEKRISWKDFFEKLDAKKLVFIYNPDSVGEDMTRECKIVAPDDLKDGDTKVV